VKVRPVSIALTNEQRHAWMLERVNEKNLEWDGLSDEQRDWWQGQAEIMRRRRAEALRGMR